MRRIRIFAHISLDGVIAPGGPDDDSEYANGGWTTPFRSAEGAAAVAEVQGNGFDLLLGRRTYDLWAGYWPKMKGGPFAENINAATKYVATHRSEGLTWGPAERLDTDIVAAVHRLKSGGGPDLIVWGSSTLTPALFKHGLVDDVALFVYPVLLGRGKRFFADTADSRPLALVSTKSTATGVLINTYRLRESLHKSPAVSV